MTLICKQIGIIYVCCKGLVNSDQYLNQIGKVMVYVLGSSKLPIFVVFARKVDRFNIFPTCEFVQREINCQMI